jgi:outer membrane protein TolC
MHRAVPILALLFAAFHGWAQTTAAAPPTPAGLTLPEVPALVLGHDTNAAISAQTTRMALHSYQGTIAQALPQIDFTTNYTLGFTPEQQSQQYSFIGGPPFFLPQSVDVTNQGNHTLGARLSLSQILPTAGTLSFSLGNTMTASTLGSESIGGVPTSPSPLYSQKPVVSLGITQPIFFNGKLIDFALFPATIRKAELGYREQNQAERAQRNQTIGQAVLQYFSVVQLRKNVAQTRKSIAVTQGNLDTLQKNYSLGAVAESDLLDAQINLLRQKQGLLELSSGLAKTERLLGHSIGRDDLGGLPLADSIPTLPFRLGSQEIREKALSGHPLLRQKGLALEEKRADEVLGGQRYASSLALSFSFSPRYPYTQSSTLFSSSPYTSDFAASFTDLFKPGWGQDYSVSAGLTIHLFDGGQQAQNRAGAQAMSALAEQGLLAQTQSVLDQVELDLSQKASLEEKVALLREAARLAERRLATEQSLLSLGKSTDLAVAERSADAEAKAIDLWRASADHYLTVIDLYSLAGEDLEKIIEGNHS